MPQCTNRRNGDNPFGKGSLFNELEKSSSRTRLWAKKVNEAVGGRTKLTLQAIDKHKRAEEERHARVTARIQKSLKEINAYKQIVRHSYKTENLMTLQWGYKPKQQVTPDVKKRHIIESRIYHCGFSRQTLRPEITTVLKYNSLEAQRAEFWDRIVRRARERSDFLIDRRITNAAMTKSNTVIGLKTRLKKNSVSSSSDDKAGLKPDKMADSRYLPEITTVQPPKTCP